MKRREFLGLGLAGACAALSYPFLLEPRLPVVERVDVAIAGLPPELDGFKLGVLSDLHRSHFILDADIRRAADLLRREEPDVVCLLGDFVKWDAAYARPCVQSLAGLSPPLGVFAILGNHEYWSDAEVVRKALEEGDVRVLVNESASLSIGGAPLFLVGLDDIWFGTPDLDRALRGVPTDAMRVLLAHEPDFADALARWRRDLWLPLQVSGHSHGGQVVLPFIGPPFLPPMGRTYVSGLNRVTGTDRLVYTTRGVGMTVPLRLNCPPEVTVLFLRSAPREAGT